MAGKLPIDRARGRTASARPYEDNKQTFAEDQARLQQEATRTAEPSPPADDARQDADGQGEYLDA